MKADQFLRAMGMVDENLLDLNEPDVPAEPALPAHEPPVPSAEPAPPVRRPSVLLRWILAGGCAAACIAGAVLLLRMIPRDDFIFTAPSGQDIEITRELSAAEQTADAAPQTTEPPQTDETVTRTEPRQTESDRTEPAEIVTGTQPAQTTAEQGASRKTSTVTTAKTTERQASSQSETTKSLIEAADPDALIKELKKGYAPGFCWDDGTDAHRWCDIGYQTYGVAFLCDDIEKLKAKGIGAAPVNWSEGAWTYWGGNGYGFVEGATAESCLVQPIEGFIKRYGTFDALGSDLPFSIAAEHIMQYRVVHDYQETGQTVYMASAGQVTYARENANGWLYSAQSTSYGGISGYSYCGKYSDYTEMIQALADDPSVTLLGLVNGEERGYGSYLYKSQPYCDIQIVFRRGAIDYDLADFSWLNELLYAEKPFDPLTYGEKKWKRQCEEQNVPYVPDITNAGTSLLGNSDIRLITVNLDLEKLQKRLGISAPESSASEEERQAYCDSVMELLREYSQRIEQTTDVMFVRPVLSYIYRQSSHTPG